MTFPSCGGLQGLLGEAELVSKGEPEGVSVEDGHPEGLCPLMILPLYLTDPFRRQLLKECY